MRLSFSFKHNGFGGYLRYLMTSGEKPSSDLDVTPARFPPDLNLEKELKATPHPNDKSGKQGKSRHRVSFDEVSNIILEGIGNGPLRSASSLEDAARQLKLKGQVELWNYLGAIRTPTELRGLVAKVWRMNGERSHDMWVTDSPFALGDFHYDHLPHVQDWVEGRGQKFVLILSGDAGFGKTQLAKALMLHVCPAGFWFIDDPDDFRDLEGQTRSSDGFVAQRVTVAIKQYPNKSLSKK